MEMERINENTIRVLIGNDDLQARGITVLDLLGNHKQIENFFYSVLEEVDTDHQFQDTDSVTFQVLPTRNGLELFISKNNAALDNKEIIDNSEGEAGQVHHAAQAKRNGGTDDDEGLTSSLKKALHGHDHAPASDDYQKAMAQREHSQSRSNEVKHSAHVNVRGGVLTHVVESKDFEDMIRVAELVQSEGVKSDLYQYDHRYYLVLKFFDDNDHTPGSIADTMAVVYEYANRSKKTADFLTEHGKRLMEQSALELLRYYFK